MRHHLDVQFIRSKRYRASVEPRILLREWVKWVLNWDMSAINHRIKVLKNQIHVFYKLPSEIRSIR